MEKITNLFGERKPLPKKTRRSERSDLIEYFYLNANADRDGEQYKKLPINFYAYKLALLNVADLY
jgi:hypothetical protein